MYRRPLCQIDYSLVKFNTLCFEMLRKIAPPDFGWETPIAFRFWLENPVALLKVS